MELNSLPHTTVFLEELVEVLLTDLAGVYVDATFGRGGHSALILQRLSPQGRLIAFDRDPSAVAVGKTWKDPRFTMVHCAFSDMEKTLVALGIAAGSVTGIGMDLGVSSPQLDEAARGFSFRFDAPLDMRMDISDQSPTPTAAAWIATASELDIRRVLHEYGEERAAARIAAKIVAVRQTEPILSTGQLAQLVAGEVKSRQPGHHPATRTFQAIRIHINGELSELESALSAAQAVLVEGGKLAVISFHSLEDRWVKQTFREPPVATALRHLPRSEVSHPWVHSKRILPQEAQVKGNPRARSAVLRVAQKQTQSHFAGGAR